MTSRLKRNFLLALLSTCLMSGCASQPFVWARDLPAEASGPIRSTLEPGDRLLVVVEGQEKLSGEFVVLPDGSYPHPMVGTIPAAGLTPQKLAEAMVRRLSSLVADPHVTVSVQQLRPLRIGVMGEVRTGGTFDVPHDEGVLYALARAGGLTEFADVDDIYVIRRTPGLYRIRFDLRELTAPTGTAATFRLRDGDVIVVE